MLPMTSMRMHHPVAESSVTTVGIQRINKHDSKHTEREVSWLFMKEPSFVFYFSLSKSTLP